MIRIFSTFNYWNEGGQDCREHVWRCIAHLLKQWASTRLCPSCWSTASARKRLVPLVVVASTREDTPQASGGPTSVSSGSKPLSGDRSVRPIYGLLRNLRTPFGHASHGAAKVGERHGA